MNVTQLSIKEFLNERGGKINIYKIPPYQREYAWGIKEWDELFDDICENDKNYFLGSVICINHNDYFEIIDGQQRATTLSLFISSIYKFLLDRKIEWYGKNDEFDEIYLSLKKHLIYNENPKLTLSIQNYNNEDYLYLLSNIGLIDEVKKPTKWGNRRIAKAYKFFIENIEELYQDEMIESVFELLQKILSAIIVKIDVDDIASAFVLFESINNRGKPLSPIDLIKNSLISKSSNPEKTNEKWQIILKNIPEPKDQIRFLRHFYNSFGLNEEKYKLFKNKKLKYQKATLSNIIYIYKDYINKNAEFILDTLIEKSKIYTLFVLPQDIENTEFREIFIRLKKLGVAPSYTLFLYLFDMYDNKEDLLKVLKLIETWFIKRNITNYPGTARLDKIFLDLVTKVYNKDNFYEIIKNELTKEEIFISDKKFKNEWLLKVDLYNENRDLLKYILIKLELSKRTNENKIEFLDFWDKKWSIEHILPQTPNLKEWDFTKDEHEEYVSKLGNFTLTHYNSNLSNKAFNKKISVIDKKTNNDIGLKSGNVKINEFIKTCDKWTKKCIDKRSEILADEIISMLII